MWLGGGRATLGLFTRCLFNRFNFAESATLSEVKVKVRTLDISPFRESSPQKHSRMARVLRGSHSFTYTPTCSIRNRNAAFASAAITGTHLPTPEGWKAELARVASYVVRQCTCSKAVTHPTTNRAQCRATALIETDALPLH